MRKVLVLFILLAVLGVTSRNGVHTVQKAEFEAQSRAASGALFVTQEDVGKRKLHCSGTAIQYKGEEYFLTARHCVWNEPDQEEGVPAGLGGPFQVSFSDNEAGPFYDAIPVRISSQEDIAVLRLINGSGPAIRLGNEKLSQAGNTLTNYSYAMDLGKLPVTLRFVAPVTAHSGKDLLQSYPKWNTIMPVDGMAAPGSSGSGLFDPRQQAVVGVLVGVERSGHLALAVPVSKVWDLLAGGPAEDLTPKQAVNPLQIFLGVIGYRNGRQR